MVMIGLDFNCTTTFCSGETNFHVRSQALRCLRLLITKVKTESGVIVIAMDNPGGWG